MTRPFIPILLGTARKDRRSGRVARYVHAQAKKHGGCETELVDARNYATPATIPPWVPSRIFKPWKKTMGAADGLIIVAPEYNHGYPGDLKIMLDSLYEEYAGKPVGVCGVSTGRFGGERMIRNLMQVLVCLRMVPLNRTVNFGAVEQLFDDNEAITDDGYERHLARLFDEIVTYAEGMRGIRKELKGKEG